MNSSIKITLKQVVLFCILNFLSGCVSESSNGDTTSHRAPNNSLLNEIFQIANQTTDNNLTDFQKSQIRGFEIFTGREIQVQGTVSEVDRNGTVSIKLADWNKSFLSGGSGILYITMTKIAVKDQTIAGAMRKDQAVSAKGVITKVYLNSHKSSGVYGSFLYIEIKDGEVF